jgi:nucleoside-diphosphate-sugar epimerase
LILVTGATGFLGRNLCRYLAAQGYALRALVRPTSDAAFLQQMGAELATGDVTDAASVRAAAHGCRHVIHTAAYFRLWGPPERFIRTNIQGTQNVLQAALVAGAEKFIHISTIIVVGPQPAGSVITETTPRRPYPSDNYAKTKAVAEQLALEYASRGLPVVALRLGALYGPHGHYAFNRLFFEEFLRNLRVQVHQGRHIIFPCYVGDAAKGIELALQMGRAGKIYNISAESISHREANRIISRLSGRSSWRINVPGKLMLQFVKFLELVARFTNREPFYPENLKPYVFDDWIVDSGKARRELGFTPSSFAAGAQQTLDWYKSVGFKV